MNTKQTISGYQQFFIDLALRKTGPNQWHEAIVGLIIKEPALFALLDAQLRDDEVFLLTALKQRTDLYLLGSDRLRSLPHIFLAAMAQGDAEVNDKLDSPDEWRLAVPDRIKNDKALIIEATALEEFAFYGLASDEIKQDDDFLIEIGKLSPHALANGVLERIREAGIDEEDLVPAGEQFLQHLLILQERGRLNSAGLHSAERLTTGQ